MTAFDSNSVEVTLIWVEVDGIGRGELTSVCLNCKSDNTGRVRGQNNKDDCIGVGINRK